MRRPRIVLYGHFGSGNVGNDTTLEAALRNFQRLAPDAHLVCVCTGPAAVAARFGIDTVPVDAGEMDRGRVRSGRLAARATRLVRRVADEGAFWMHRTRWLREADLFVIAGTGALDDMAVPRPWNAPYDLFKWCRAARIAGAPVVFLSVGAGPIEHPWSRRLMVSALRAADYRSYRDEPSLAYARSVGVDTEGGRIYPDLGFSLPGRDWRAVRPPADPPRTVGVGVIGYYGWRHDQRLGEPLYQSYVDKVKQFTGWLLSRGYEVRVIGGDVPTDDRPVADVVGFVRSSGHADWLERLHAEPVSSLEDLCRELSLVDVLVATRFHNVLTALMLARPTVSIGYHAKNEALMADMGLGDYCQHIERIDLEQLKGQFERLTSEAGRASGRLREIFDVYRARLDEQYRTVLALTLPRRGVEHRAGRVM